ncbi:hypothetical protein RRG08_042349 [Elysia crispata]|uniref:DNA2/NAM7 helicase-like C-terminal domain-containing protein n=1 Tax=Elysia crispata TaxID=231223 RepID=A0AAE0ZBT9_9GAST|nr:hypothetical protein RRG08_042349 [Elysia crispata]
MLIRKSVPLHVSVSTVLESMGRESDYVILSTVRSMPFDKLERPVSTRWAKEHIGDIADSRMINLAITRTRAALFIFGNKDLLGCCEPWQSLLNSFRHHQCLQTDWSLFLETFKTY